MDKDSIAHLDQKIANGVNFNFGKYFSDGFKYTNANIGMQLAFGLLCIVGILVVSIIPFVGSIANSLFIQECLNVGFALGTMAYLRKNYSTIEDHFGGFKFIPQIIINRLLLCLTGIILIPLYFIGPIQDLFIYYFEFVGSGEAPDMEVLKYLVEDALPYILLIGVVLGFLFTPILFCSFFIVFYKLNGWQAIVYSYKFMTKKWLQVYALVFVSMLFFIVGFIVIFVGAFYTYPVMRNILFACFKDMTGLEENFEGQVFPENSNNDLLDSDF